MLKTKIFCLLQVFLVVNAINLNGWQKPRMKWKSKPDELVEKVLRRTQGLLSGSGAFNYLGNPNSKAFGMVKFARSTLETNSFLFLIIVRGNIKHSSPTLFFTAATFDEKPNLVYLNWIGEISKVTSEYSLEPRMKVQYAAELYAQSHYAFQQIWELPDTYNNNSLNLSVAAPNEMTIPTKSGRAHIFYLIKYWIVTPNQEMVVLYANKERTKGAYATVANHPTSNSPKPEIIRLEASESSFAETFDALWENLDAGLAFESGWNLVTGKIDPKLASLESRISYEVHWLPKNSSPVLFAQTDEWNGLIGTIFKTSGSYRANTLFAIWSIPYYLLLHVSLAGTLKQTLASYRGYCTMGLLKDIHHYCDGMAYWKVGKNPFADKYWTAIKSALENSKYEIPDCTTFTLSEEFGILPNPAHEDYKSIQNICIVVKDQNEKRFPALIKIQTQGPEGQPTVAVEDVALENRDSVEMPDVVARKMVKARHTLLLAWTFGAPKGVDISAVSTFIMSKSVTDNCKILYSFGSSEKMLVIIKFPWKNEHGIESEYVCFIALRKSDQTFKVTWVGTQCLAVGLTEAINASKSEAEKYHYKSTFGYEENWEFNVAHQGKQPNSEVHCVWEIPDNKHKIQIFREQIGELYKFWYQPLFKSGDSSSYTQVVVGRKDSWIGNVLQDLAKHIDNPLLYSQLSYTGQIEKFPGIRIQEMIDGVEAKYFGNGDFLFETLVSPVDDPTKAVLVFNHEANENEKIGMDTVDSPHVQYSTAATDVKVLVPCLHFDGMEHASTFKRHGEMLEVKGDWRDSIGTHLLDPFLFTPEIKWKNCKHQFDEKAVDHILYNAPWKANVKGFITEKVKMIHWILQHPTWIGNAFYICSLDEKDTKLKFLVVWNHRGSDVSHKLRYVGGLGSAEDVQKDYARYVSSDLALQEAGFTHGIAKYDKTSEAVKKGIRIVQDFLGKTYLEKPKEVELTALLESYRFGRISTPFGVYPEDEHLYCLYGNTNLSKTAPVYATILINAKETMHGMKCLSFRAETTLPRSVLQAENDLAKFIAQHHMRRSPETKKTL